MADSRLLGWSVENFMSIEKGSVEYDDTNIINFKGYNDSGKSAMLTALKVLMANSNPSKQLNFIQDDKSYFRVVARFSDGVTILRDKYINGQSLYEMYVNGETAFSTKVNGVLTKVDKVPQMIADYLGLITFDGICLNARSCFEKQIGVQTTGSENYRMFNVVLRSEELASAGQMLNTDRNKLASDIAIQETELRAMRSMYDDRITAELVSEAKNLDSILDEFSHQNAVLGGISQIASSLASIHIGPELQRVNGDRLSQLGRLGSVFESLNSIHIAPALDSIDGSKLPMLMRTQQVLTELDTLKVAPSLDVLNAEQLTSLRGIVSAFEHYNAVQVAPEVHTMDSARLDVLLRVRETLDALSGCDTVLASLDSKLEKNTELLAGLEAESDGAFVRCPNCGLVFEAGGAHAHS